jgi:long-chain acyl-CoA synthetase
MYESKPWLAHYGAAPASLEYPESSVFGMLAADAVRLPKVAALKFMGRTTSKAALLDRVIHMSRAFAAEGMKKGDRVLVCLPNIPQAAIAIYALSRLGAIPAPIHPLSTTSEILAFARLVSASWAITLDGFFPRFVEIAEGTAGRGEDASLGACPIRKILVCEIGAEAAFPISLGYTLGPGRKIAPVPYGDGGPQGVALLSWRELEAKALHAPELAQIDPLGAEEAALILFSGGSTGESKAILLSNRNCNALAIQTNASGGPILPGDVMLSILPTFHGFGLAVGIHAFLVQGGTCVLVPRFKARTIAPLVRKHKPAFMAGVPTLFDALASDRKFQRTPLGSFKGIFCGGDSLSPETKRRFEAVLKRNGGTAVLREGYGMTESVTANMLVPSDEYRERSIGVPYPDMLAKIVRPGSTDECAVMEEGEICISGPTVMIGYLDDPEATAEVLKKHSDGRTWLHSGDIGCMDADGFFYFRQRAKRIIKTSGIAVYPSQVEDVLNKHPAVRLSCVIGVPHPTQVEVPKGFVTLNEGYAPTTALGKELIDYCRQHLIPHSCPRRIEFLPELPMTRVGKVAFRVLQERETAKRSEAEKLG